MDRDRLVRLVVLLMLLPTLMYYIATVSSKTDYRFSAYGALTPPPGIGRLIFVEFKKKINPNLKKNSCMLLKNV